MAANINKIMNLNIAPNCLKFFSESAFATMRLILGFSTDGIVTGCKKASKPSAFSGE
jgi:hypothetical protein